MKRLASLAALAVLAACAAPPPPAGVEIPAEVLALLPPGVTADQVYRRQDGCYFIVIQDDLTGVIRPIEDSRGSLVCDD